MINIYEVDLIHSKIIDRFGGSYGIRDRGLLESSIVRPFQEFDGKQLYPSIIEKSASLIQSILSNHPFVDGNKRTGYVLMRLMLNKNGIILIASESEKYDFVIKIATSEYQFDDIIKWLKLHT